MKVFGDLAALAHVIDGSIGHVWFQLECIVGVAMKVVVMLLSGTFMIIMVEMMIMVLILIMVVYIEK